MSLLSSNKVLISLPKKSYLAGETISGTIELAFSEDVKADGIIVDLICTKKYSNYSFSKGSASYSSTNQIIHSQPITIAGPGIYGPQKMSFEYLVPLGIIPKQFTGFGKIGNLPEWVVNIINVAMTVFGFRPPQYTLEFMIQVVVDIPWGINIVEKNYIAITSKDSGTLMIDIPSFDPGKPAEPLPTSPTENTASISGTPTIRPSE